jgi:hypothetical protein
MLRSWKMWLVVLLALAGLTEGAGLLLDAQGSSGAGGVVRFLGRLSYNAWVIYGLIVWREVPWVRRFGLLLLGTAVAQMLFVLFWAMGSTEMAIATAGAYAMGVVFYAGLLLLRLLLSPARPMFGVARTLIDEAIRMKIALVPIIIMVVLIAVLPFVIDQEDFLKYRITSFLTWSLMVTSALLSLMTLFLSVGTITREQSQKQVFLTLTKPIGRGEYLLGKWLGITLLNLVLISVAGAGVYSFTKLLESQPARDGTDRLAVDSQVLVARRTVQPTPPDPTAFHSRFTNHLERLRQQDPERFGNPGDPVERVLPDDLADVQQQVMIQWYSIPSRDFGSYRFAGLEQAVQYGQPIQLRFKPRISGDTDRGFVYLRMRINGRDYPDPVTGGPVIKLAEDNFHVLDIPANVIDEAGGITIDIFNPNPESTLRFNPKDGVEVLYRVGGFEGNLVRSLGIIWIRLMFLAMLGLAAGAYLGFPVASLLCLLIYFAAAGSAYLAESLQFYAAFPKATLSLPDQIAWLISKVLKLFGEGDYYELFKMLIKAIASGFLLVTPSFGDFNPTPLVSDGRLVPWGMLGNAAWRAGLVWTGSVGFLGWVIFRARELARVTV